jgi:hypothetical protein
MSIFRKQAKQPTEAELALAQDCREHGSSVRINALAPRCAVEVVGMVEHVTTIDLEGTPAFEISINDGTGSMVALWTGRKSIACVERGRRIALWGRVAPTTRQDYLVVHNPRYELL